jgi:hypothetical protein
MNMRSAVLELLKTDSEAKRENSLESFVAKQPKSNTIGKVQFQPKYTQFPRAFLHHVILCSLLTYLLLGSTAHAGPWPPEQSQTILLYFPPLFAIF